MPRVGNKGSQKAVRPDEKQKGVDELAGVEKKEQDEEGEDVQPKGIELETRKTPGEGNDEDGEEEEPRRVGKNEGVGRMRNIGDPRLPSRKEVKDHYLAHVPYRNWSPHSVRGRGKDLDHRKSVEEDRRIREFSFDYCFPGDEKGARIAVLLGRERVTGMTMASVVPVKGTSGQFAAMKVLDFIKECGAAETEIILKTDQEPAIEALMADVVKTRRAAITVLEKSPVGSSGSNGVVERGVQSVEGLIRTLLSACQERLGTRIMLEEKIVIFMAEYAAYLINRLEVGKDGKTAYERCRGKGAIVMAIEFGEKLLWKVRQKNRLEYGVFVGVKATSCEVWVATKEGLQTVRSVRRIPVEERWNENNKDFVKHVPWNKSGEDPEADGDLPGALEGATATGEAAAGSMDPPRVIVVNTKEVAPREFYIQKKNVEAYGHTKGCPGCRTMFQGGTRQAHTTECRERFRDLMKDEDKVVKTLERGKDGGGDQEDGDEEAKKGREEGGEKRTEEGGGWRRDGGREHEGFEEQEEAGGDGMTIEAVLRNDEAWDDVKGGWLDREKVREARMEEVGYMKRKML